MPLFFRRILFIFFVLLFALSAVVLLFTASGYRYHAAKRVIEKTGTLIVETLPRGARVTFNNIPRDGLTPVTISPILSGTYTVTLEKEGFFPVTRRITIAPGRSEIINDIVLIRQGEPRLHAPLEGVREALRRGGQLIVRDTRGVTAVDLATGRVSRIVDGASEPITDMVVSPSGGMVAVRTSQGWRVGDTTTDVFKDMRFAKDGDTLYARAEDGVYRFDKEKEIFVPVVRRDNVRSFHIRGNVLRALTADSVLREFRVSDGALIREIVDGPALEDILESSHDTLVLRGAGRSLYLFDPDAQKLSFQHVSDASSIRFMDRARFFSFNEFEIWEHTFTPERYTRTLVTRQSTPIVDSAPFPRRPFIVSASENGEVRMRRLGTGEGQEVLLAVFDTVRALFVNDTETAILVAGSYHGQDGIFTLTVIEEEPVFPLVK